MKPTKFNGTTEQQINKQQIQTQEELDSELLAPAPVPATRAPAAAASSSLPAAPTRPVAAAAKKTREEEELEALEREMAL